MIQNIIFYIIKYIFIYYKLGDLNEYIIDLINYTSRVIIW